ncbi:hypothetical protein JW911_04000 [Candidatus Peregrinibacteria bacterium]|nr:hypothetical protein [Candidatus Peregrinibacteria bacterium]
MKLKNQFEFLFVGKEEGSFLENYAYDLGEGEEAAGQLFVNVEIQNNPADAEVIAETIFDSARKIFFSDLEKDVYTRFEDALKEVNKAITAFKAETVSKFIGNIHAVISVVAGKELHLSQCGDAEAYLIRKKFCSIISEGLSDAAGEVGDETFSNIASGTLEPGDFVVFATTRLLRYISKTDYIQTMRPQDLKGSLADLSDALAPEILSKIGIIGIVFHEGLSALTDSEKKGVREYLEDEKPGFARRDRIKLNKGIGFLKGVGKKIVHYMNEILTGMTSKQMTKDKILVLLIIIIVLLTGVIWYVKNSGAQQRELERLDAVLTTVREEINTASLRGLSNKDGAAQILADAENKAMEVLNSGNLRSKANELLGLIQEEKKKLDNVVYVTNPRVIANLAEKRENVSALGMIPQAEHLYVYEYNALYDVLIDRVESPVTIDDNETVISGVYDNDNKAMLFITKSGKVIQYANGQFQFMDTDDSTFRKGVAIDSYNGRMYLLDAESNQVWRYAKKRDQYGSAEGYITSGTVTNPVDLAIDGFIYVLQNDGKIMKFDRGAMVDFAVEKAPLDPIQNPTRIHTELDLNKIFILEPSKYRVVVLEKDIQSNNAVYSTQYVFDSINDVRDMYYDKGSNRLYLLDPQRIYEVIL